eukprot:1475544-Prymnesium_polylepis.1
MYPCVTRLFVLFAFLAILCVRPAVATVKAAAVGACLVVERAVSRSHVRLAVAALGGPQASRCLALSSPSPLVHLVAVHGGHATDQSLGMA